MNNTTASIICIFLFLLSFQFALANELNASSLNILMPDPPIVEDVNVCFGESTEIIPMVAGGGSGPITSYNETFDTDGEGVAGSCASGTCATDVPPVNGQWSISGNFSGLTAATDFVITNGGQLTFQDLDEEVCFMSSTIDITGCTNVDFSIDISEIGSHEASDYVDVNLIVDGIPMPISNWMGFGSTSHTLVDDFGSRTVTATGITGTSLVVEVCVLNNVGTEQIVLDNINVLCSNAATVVFKYYDADPAGGLANLLAGPTIGGYDPMTYPYSPDVVWVTSCDNTGESAANMVTVTVTDLFFFGGYLNYDYCEGDEIEPIEYTSTFGEVYTFYDDYTLSNVVGIGSYTPDLPPGYYEIYITQSLNGCESPAEPIFVYIEELPLAPMISSATYCLGDPIPAVEFPMSIFYSDPTLLNLIGYDSYLPAGIVGTETLYVTQLISVCESEATQVDIIVENCTGGIPSPMVEDIDVCDGESTLIIPTSSISNATFKFYDADPALVPANLLAGPTTGGYDPMIIAGTDTTIWVTTCDVTGESAAASVLVTNNAVPNAPVISSEIYCTGDLISAISVPSSTFYSDITLMNTISNELYQPTGFLGTETFYVQVTNGSCESIATEVNITVETCVSTMVMADNILTCDEGDTQIVPTSDMPATTVGYNFYNDDPSLASTLLLESIASEYTTNTLTGNIDTIWITAFDVSGAESPAIMMTVSVVLTPDAPSFNIATQFCVDETTPTISGPYNFYSDSALTTLIAQDTYSPSSAIVGIETIYITETNGSGITCESDPTTISFTVTAPVAGPTIMDITVCDGESTLITPEGAMSGTGTSNVYTEIFDTDGEGIAGACSGSTTATCITNIPPANAQWSITGDVSGLTATTDFAITSGGGLEFQDTDTEVCFTTTTIDISGCTTSDFSVDITEIGSMESTDYVDVDLIIDGVSNPIINWTGLGDATHTLIDDFTASVVTQTGIMGSTIVVEICVLNNSGTEQFFLDNIVVGCEGSGGGDLTYKYYDVDPINGAAPIAGPTEDPLDPMTAAGDIEMIWVTSCEGACESEATKVTVTVNPIPLAPSAMGAVYCEGDVIADILATGETGASFTYYSDMTLMTVLQTGASYTPIGTVGIETIFITQTLNACESEALEITIEVLATPVAPLVESVTFCIGEPTEPVEIIGDPAATFTHYSDAALTNIISTGATYTPIGTPGTETVFATQTLNGCESAATAFTITIAGFENITAAPSCNANALDYCLDIAFDYAGPGISNMYEVIVNGIVYGPFTYGTTGSETLTVCDPINFIGDEQTDLAIEVADVDRGNITEGVTQTGGGVTDPEGCVEISAVMPDQNADNDGDGLIDFCDEYVSITNGGTGIIEISNYTISDAASVRHIFPAGSFLNPGQTLILYNSSMSEITNCANSGIWNNGGDDVILNDGLGSLVDTETYNSSTTGEEVTFTVEGCGMGSTTVGISACVQVNSVMADQAADNNGDGGIDFCDEFITVTNPGTIDLDISEYTISDAASLRHIFPAGTVLVPGEVLFIFNSELSEVTNCENSGIWNNGGDDIIIADATGLVVDSESYGSTQTDVELFFTVEDCPSLTIDMSGICSGIIEFDEPNCCPVIEVASFMGMSICAGSCPAPGSGLMATADCGTIATVSDTKWYSDPAGLFLVFEGAIFDPISEGVLDNSVAGEFIFYAQVSCSFCTSALVPVTVDIFDCDPPNDGCGGCTYFVQLYDSGFDGWEGGRFLVSLNDGPFTEYKLTASDNGFLSFPIEMVDGGTIDYMYMEGGDNSENAFKIIDGLGNTVASEGDAFTGSNIEAGVEKSVKVDCPECCEDASEVFTFVFTSGQDAFEKSWEIRDNSGSRIAFVNAGGYSGVFNGQSVSTSLTLDPCEEYTIATFSARNNGWEEGTYQIFSDNPDRGTFVSSGVYLIAEGPDTFTDELLSTFTLPCSLTCPAEETILADDLDNCVLNTYTASLIDAPVCYPNNCHYSPLPTLEVCYPTAIGGLVEGALGTTSASLPVGSNPVIYKVIYSDGQIRKCTSQVHVISEINPVLVCNDFVTVPLIYDGSECETIITADMILEASDPCNAQYFIELTDANGNEMSNVISLDDSGQILNYTITQIGTGLSSLCEGQILVEDKAAPIIACTDYEINCNHPNALDPFYTHTEEFAVSAGELPGNIAGGTATNPSQLFLPIPDVGCGPYGEIIQDINVSIELEHNDIEDLTLVLVAPNGTSITLLERRTCNNQSSQNINVTFDSEATTPVFSGCIPGIPGLTGTYSPAEPLSSLYNMPYKDLQGEWMLIVSDDDDTVGEGIGVGEVISASIEITAGFPTPYSVTDCNLQAVNLISEQIVETDCDQGEWLGSKIIRTWQAEDSFGNSSICTQTVGLRAPMLTELDVPEDLDLECGTVPSDPELITPEVGGISFFECFELNENHINACDIIITYEDEVFASCGNGFKIFRTWKVLNWCSGSQLTHVQTILVTDTEGPEITQNAVTIGTNGEACTADVTLADLEVVDVCSNVTNISATYTIGSNLNILNLTNGEAITGLSLGNTVVTISATDECQNTSVQDLTITVVDDVNPTAICDDELNITLSDSGIGELSAVNFDEGSNDHCSDVSVLIRSLGCEGGSFSEVAEFGCCDLGEVRVELLVTDAAGNTNICWAMLSVEDASAPTITCEADITITCDEEIQTDDLFTTPAGMDNCNYSIEESEVIEAELPNCGQLLRKTYTATDGSDKSNDVSCTQSVTIVHVSDFIVQFPVDITLEGCPEDLATIASPIVTEDDCEQIGISFVDRVFNQVEDVCYKIERTYTIINHCVISDPSIGGFSDLGTPLPIPRTYRDDDGYFQYTQIIKVQDEEAPVITFTAPDPCDFTDGCEGELVLIATADDACSSLSALNFSWKIDEFGDGTYEQEGTGNDATGVYPYGDHIIQWSVSDGCGNESVMSADFEVRDCKNPTPTCQAVTTVVMNNGDCVSINAGDLLEYAIDNCTERTTVEWKANARARIASGSSALTTSVELCCEDIFQGSIPVEVWVEDEAGNADFCVVNVTVQDNMGNCPEAGFQSAKLIGSVKTITDLGIQEVNIAINGQEMTSTNDQGNFDLDLSTDQDYRVVATKNTNASEGISTFDLVLMTQHVLQIRSLDNPYVLLAADVNRDGNIDIFDLVEERQLILFQIQNFSQSDSWLFLPADYEFVKPESPFAESASFYLDINLQDDYDNANFIGIKIGDLDNSAMDPFTSVEERKFPQTLIFEVDDQELNTDATYEIDFRAKDFVDISGFQFTLDFDPSILSIIDVKGESIQMDRGNYGQRLLEIGKLTSSYNVMQDAISISDNEVLFTITVQTNQSVVLSEALSIAPNYTLAEAYTKMDDLIGLDIRFNESSSIGATELELYQNTPNPFKAQTDIGFTLPVASTATLTIYDVSGKVLYQSENQYERGFNSIRIEGKSLLTSGLLYYSIESEQFKAVKKMIFLD